MGWASSARSPAPCTGAGLHSSLFAKEAGKAVLTLAALAYVVLLASGICLWWPVRWRQAFSFRRGAGLTHSLYDWHRVTGVVCGLLVGVCVVSGAYMAWPPLAKWVSHLSGAPQTRPPVVVGGPASTEVVQGTIERAQAMFPKAMVGYVQVPAWPDQALRVRLRLPDDPHPNGLTSVWFHPHDGEVMAVNRWSELDPGTRAYSYVYPPAHRRAGRMAHRPGDVPDGRGADGICRHRHPAVVATSSKGLVRLSLASRQSAPFTRSREPATHATRRPCRLRYTVARVSMPQGHGRFMRWSGRHAACLRP